MEKRGLSPVIATVLLIVITVSVAAVILSFVLPFANDKLSGSKACLDALSSVEFANSKFNCFDSTSSETGFSIKLSKEGVTAFRVALIDSNDNSDSFDISEGIISTEIRMVGQTYSSALEFPNAGGQRTYVSSNTYVKAEISPVLEDGQVCDVADRITFSLCDGSVTL